LTPIRKSKPDTANRDEHIKNTGLTNDYNLRPMYEKCEYYWKVNSLIRIT